MDNVALKYGCGGRLFFSMMLADSEEKLKNKGKGGEPG